MGTQFMNPAASPYMPMTSAPNLPMMPGGYPSSSAPPVTGMPGFPFGRAASESFMKDGPFGRGGLFGGRGGPFGGGGGLFGGRGGHCGPPPGMHGGWPFTQSHPYMPGNISVPVDDNTSNPVTRSAEQIHSQVFQMEDLANRKENQAFELRKNSTERGVAEKETLRMWEEATKLEEEAEKCRREADRLRAEAVHLDGELARELEEEDGGQQTGVIPGAFN